MTFIVRIRYRISFPFNVSDAPVVRFSTLTVLTVDEAPVPAKG